MRQFLLLFVLCIALSAQAQVVINEISAANLNGIPDNFGEYEDWIELYNNGANAVNLSGYYLSDNPNNPEKWALPATNLAAGAFLHVWSSDRDDATNIGNLHTNFKITQTQNESVLLRDPAGNIADQFDFDVPLQVGHSYGRTTDGAPTWSVFDNPSIAGSNNFSTPHTYANKPQIGIAAGLYASAVTVTVIADAGTEIRYTTNGDEPIATSTLYTGPISISTTKVLKARAYGTGAVLPSLIETNTYFIADAFTVPVISISGRDLPDLLNGGWGDPSGCFELFSPEGALIDECDGSFNKHGNDSWAYDQRGVDFISRDQMGISDAIYNQIFPTVTDRERFQRLILKPAANDNYPLAPGAGAHIRDAYVHHLSQRAGLELDERSYEPCLVFLNGEYWGVYEVREKVDDSDYTKYYYGQGEKWIDFIKTWGGTWEEYGTWDDWYPLRDYILNNDMSVQANYEYVKTQFEVQSLIDYMVLNTYVVCQDWLNWNTAWWRGRNPDGDAKKWRYALWDEDATFGHYINYTGIPNSTPTADPCDIEQITSDGQGHVAMVESLMENEEFHSLYVNRFADLNNTYFSCDYMITLLDSLIDRIEPEMQRQIDRWGGSYSGWQNNVQELRDFINDRCPQIDGGIVDCYEVTGPVTVTVNIEPVGSPNQVKVNTIIPETYPFVGDYFVPVGMNFAAVPADGWAFSHWEVANNIFAPNASADTISLAFEQSDVLTAYFVAFQPCQAPAQIDIDSSMSSIGLNWNNVSSAISYEIRYRKTGDPAWLDLGVVNSDYIIPSLEACTPYEVEIRTICGFSVGEYTHLDLQTACTVGTSDPRTGATLQVSPNPFGHFLDLGITLPQPESVAVRLLAADGRIVSEQRTQATQIRINTDQLPAGIYLIQVLGARTQLTQTVVKQ